ncbi:DUF1685 family protein [Melia azedarach]|uniref:DUF1685 family protein n=1 Tax=Melia azedarach TaxID=155640 RepID=A0ACC1Z2K4_MELAZ|nr:DUF1685 family protein [Melia azedarach]
MAAEEIFELLDSYWFGHEIFSKKPTSTSSPQKTNTILEIQEEVREPMFSSLPILHLRSMSDHALSCKTSFSPDSLSQESILTTPKLQTIFAGKEVIDFAGANVKEEEEKEKEKEMEAAVPVKRKVSNEKRRRRKKDSKSLSDLEFEELKGFMDLGFVFSEEDKDSSLVSIIPGLQRLKRDGTGENNVHEQDWINKPTVSRPYLSEAWDALDQRKPGNSLMNWRIPSVGNEVNMKDHLKFWAHTVASTVR